MKAVEVIQGPGTEIFWAGDEIVGVAAVDEGTAEDALRAIKVEYEVLPHFVSDAEPPKNIAADTGPISATTSRTWTKTRCRTSRWSRASRRTESALSRRKDYESMKGMGVDPAVIAALRKAKFVPAPATAKSPYKKTAQQNSGHV